MRGPGAASSARTPSPADDREVHLAEAGRLLREWTATRRANWSDSSSAPDVPAANDTPAAPLMAARVDGEAAPSLDPIEEEETIAPAFNFAAFPVRSVEAPKWFDRGRDALGASGRMALRGVEAGRRTAGVALRVGRLAVPALQWLARAVAIALRQLLALISRVPAPMAIRWALRTVVLASCVLIVGVVGVIGREYWLVWKNSPGLGTAVLDSDLPDAFVSVDGSGLGMAPLTTALTVGRHVVQFSRKDETRRLEIDVVEGQSTVARLEWKRTRASARQRAEADATASGAATRAADVAAAAVAPAPEAAYGSIQVESPIPVEIIDENSGSRLNADQLARMVAGPHDLRFENVALGWSEARRIDVTPGESARLTLAPPPSALTVTATVPADVLIDGTRVGEAPLIDYPVTLGAHEIAVRSLTGDERHVPLMMTTAPSRVDIDFSAR